MRKTITQIAAKPKSKSSSQVWQRKRVVAYTRVSTEQDEQLNSLAVQQRYFEEFINKNPEWTNVMMASAAQASKNEIALID